MEIKKSRSKSPFFSVCIPQYNRFSFLLEVCRSLARQTFRDFEICISDDCSPERREQEIIDFLQEAGLSFVYHRLDHNRRYDGNLRSAISLAQGKYIFLLGNDDSLARPETLENLYHELQALGEVGVVFTNYEDYDTGQPYPRVQKTELVGRGPEVAARTFRDFSFLSGVLLDRQLAQEFITEKWDGSEMYQMYLGCRIIAAGAPLAAVNQTTIRKDIRLVDEEVDSYATRPREANRSLKARHLPLGQIGQLVVDAISPYATDNRQRQKLIEKVYLQLYLFTYPFWLFEYRRVQSWRYAVSVYLGLRPRYTMSNVAISALSRGKLTALFNLVSLIGLTLNQSLFQSLRSHLHVIAKTYR